MFDFGPATVSGTDFTNSPWYTADPSAGTSWNKITGTDNTAVADVTSGLSYSDGSVATGVGFNFGVSSTAAPADGGSRHPANSCIKPRQRV